MPDVRAVSAAILAVAVWLSSGNGGQPASRADFEALPFAPKQYVCYRNHGPIRADGRLDEPAWRAAPWTDAFVDIQGESAPKPRFATRAKMLWDDRAFYVAAEMEDRDLWATLTERDAVIYQDNDFEIFIDPDGDTHNYYELEVNALGTEWDLLLVKPYRDGGPALNAWDLAGLQTGVQLRGTLNRPGDRDEGWTIEIVMPWRSLAEAAPGHKSPSAGDQWRVNFSRVQWRVRAPSSAAPGETAGKSPYEKMRDEAGKLLPEDNWVWSPQGAIDMHMPERWGYVQFSPISAGEGQEPFITDRNQLLEWALRRLYYRQRAYRQAHGRYSTDLDELKASEIQLPDGSGFRPVLHAAPNVYEMTVTGAAGTSLHIRDDGRAWRSGQGMKP